MANETAKTEAKNDISLSTLSIALESITEAQDCQQNSEQLESLAYANTWLLKFKEDLDKLEPTDIIDIPDYYRDEEFETFWDGMQMPVTAGELSQRIDGLINDTNEQISAIAQPETINDELTQYMGGAITIYQQIRDGNLSEEDFETATVALADYVDRIKILIGAGVVEESVVNDAATSAAISAVIGGADLSEEDGQQILGLIGVGNIQRVRLEIVENISDEEIQQRIQNLENRLGIDMGALNDLYLPNETCTAPPQKPEEPETPREQGYLNGMLRLQLSTSSVIHGQQHNPTTATEPNPILSEGTGLTLYGLNTLGAFEGLGNRLTFTVIEDEERAQQLRESLEEHGLTIVHGTIDDNEFIIGINNLEFNRLSPEQQNEIIETINEFEAANTEKAHDKTLASTEDYTDPNELQNTNLAKPYLPA